MKLVGKLIKWHRNKYKITQELLAEDICSVTQLSKIENGQIQASEEILISIAQRLGIPEQKFTNPIDQEHKQMAEQLITAIHEYDIPKARELEAILIKKRHEDLHYDLEFLCLLARFGYLLLMKQLKDADELYETIMEYDEIFEEAAPYSFHKFLGDYLINKCLFIDAKNHLLKAKNLLPDQEDPELYILLATAESHLENVLTSNQYARKALRILQEKLYYSRIIECEIILSSNYTFVSEYQQAKEHLERLDSLIDHKFEPSLRVKIYFHLGLIHAMTNDFEEAIQLLDKNLSTDVNETELMHSRYLLAHTYYIKDLEDKALELIQEGQAIAQEHQLNYYSIKFKSLKLVIENKREELVHFLNDQAIPFFKATGQAFDLRYYYQLLGHTLYRLKKYKRAAEVLMIADEQRKRFLEYNIDKR
ncbi:helix-turn-helix domain-containing protein [Piscibacillus sp. B03]|uniref:helix-turn-helix domain-containing protein n=1 Tax=Piscibacillus sp. B03 TaxID=3457430 RepID=UPI003FCCFFBD